MDCKFYVGQKVVCVMCDPTGNWRDHERLLSYPKDGDIVTIREIYADPKRSGMIGLRFFEHRNDCCPGYDPPMEFGFRYEEFRPLDERKTDISVFLKMLEPKRRRVDA